jgi:curved DNA-binding protein CbpA
MDLVDGEIEQAALMMSAELHPLVASGDPDAEGRLAAVNDARRVLSNPESRASTLLVLRGGPPASADKSLPPGFLMEMMEIREGIEMVAESRDVEGLRTWRKWASGQRRDYAQKVTALFEKSGDAGALVAIRRELNAWRYIERLIEQLDGGSPM